MVSVVVTEEHFIADPAVAIFRASANRARVVLARRGEFGGSHVVSFSWEWLEIVWMNCMSFIGGRLSKRSINPGRVM